MPHDGADAVTDGLLIERLTALNRVLDPVPWTVRSDARACSSAYLPRRIDMNLYSPHCTRGMCTRVRTMGRLAAIPTAVLAGIGWTYELSRLGWLDVGPRAGDALPLLQLAGFDGQPAGRLVAAWLLAGAMAGMALARVKPVRRGVLALTLGTVVLAASSYASYALARNLRLATVLPSRHPGAGVWIEGLLFAIGCALPGARNLALGRREHRDAGEHQANYAEVSEHHGRGPAERLTERDHARRQRRHGRRRVHERD